ncbi:hypothetical protein C8R47DRAFT_1190543 [Mycena vitilis]|nr:hypothetical protein C8R47DRAFT_1190543 [Mycena vitilis]
MFTPHPPERSEGASCVISSGGPRLSGQIRRYLLAANFLMQKKEAWCDVMLSPAPITVSAALERLLVEPGRPTTNPPHYTANTVRGDRFPPHGTRDRCAVDPISFPNFPELEDGRATTPLLSCATLCSPFMSVLWSNLALNPLKPPDCSPPTHYLPAVSSTLSQASANLPRARRPPALDGPVLDLYKTAWPAYTPPRNIGNLISPWVPSPDSSRHNAALSGQVRKLVDVSHRTPYHSASSTPAKLCGLKSRPVERGVENTNRKKATCETKGATRIPLSEWRAFAAYSRPTVNGVDVHNTLTPSPTPYRIADIAVNAEEIFESLLSPSGGIHPERWVRGLQHPSLPPPPSELWSLPSLGELLSFPWECKLNYFLKPSVSGPAPVEWNIRSGARTATCYSPQESSLFGLPKWLAPAQTGLFRAWAWILVASHAHARQAGLQAKLSAWQATLSAWHQPKNETHMSPLTLLFPGVHFFRQVSVVRVILPIRRNNDTGKLCHFSASLRACWGDNWATAGTLRDVRARQVGGFG